MLDTCSLSSFLNSKSLLPTLTVALLSVWELSTCGFCLYPWESLLLSGAYTSRISATTHLCSSSFLFSELSELHFILKMGIIWVWSWDTCGDLYCEIMHNGWQLPQASADSIFCSHWACSHSSPGLIYKPWLGCCHDHRLVSNQCSGRQEQTKLVFSDS